MSFWLLMLPAMGTNKMAMVLAEAGKTIQDMSASQKQEAFSKNIFHLLIIAGVAVVLALFCVWIKKRMSAGDDDQTGLMPAFTLHDLKQMRDQGQITQEEFERCQTKMLRTMGVTPPSDTAGIDEAADAATASNLDNTADEPDAPTDTKDLSIDGDSLKNGGAQHTSQGDDADNVADGDAWDGSDEEPPQTPRF